MGLTLVDNIGRTVKGLPSERRVAAAPQCTAGSATFGPGASSAASVRSPVTDAAPGPFIPVGHRARIYWVLPVPGWTYRYLAAARLILPALTGADAMFLPRAGA